MTLVIRIGDIVKFCGWKVRVLGIDQCRITREKTVKGEIIGWNEPITFGLNSKYLEPIKGDQE